MNKKDQAPSWCDRILIRKKPTKWFKILKYDLCDKQKNSDHKPVIGVYEVETEQYDFLPQLPLHKKSNIYNGLLKFNSIILNLDVDCICSILETL